MCCFSRPVSHVGSTRIFARQLGGGRQALVYSMNVEVDEATAMVLPVPTAAGGEDALAFVDLSGYAGFFEDLGRAFPEPPRYTGPYAPAALGGAGRLRVHRVGAVEASFAPSVADLDRLDPRFRLTPALFAARPAYRDWGFAVFQLAPRQRRWWSWSRSKAQTIHPMAFSFVSREPDALFCPTVHVHDGTVPAQARFDHELFAQVDAAGLGKTLGWAESQGPASRWVKAGRCHGLVDGAAPLRRLRLQRQHRNVDLWVRPARFTRPLAAAGEGWRWTLAARSVHGAELR